MRVMEKEMATHSSILAWRNPWTEEPGRLWSVGSQSVGHNWATITHMRVKHDLKRQTFSRFVGKSEYPSPKWLKLQQNNKDDVEQQWRHWLECVGPAEISTSPRRKPTQMLLPNKTLRSPGSLSPRMYKTLLKERWDDISLSADRSIPKKWKF